MLLLAALSLYTSYTANIVALLQSTTDSIKSVADLLHSPLKCGAHDIVYNRYYFKVLVDITNAITYEQTNKSCLSRRSRFKIRYEGLWWTRRSSREVKTVPG